MVNAILDIPPIALATSPNFHPEFSGKFAELKEKKTKEVQKNADNQLLKKEVDEKQKKSESEQIKQADFSKLSEQLKKLVDYDTRSMVFAVDEETKKMIIKVIDNKTNEVISQYPSDVSLKIARFVASTLDSGNVTNARI